MTALVTGATGFLGSQLVRTLLKAGSKVRIFRRATSGFYMLGKVKDEVDHSVGDITDMDALCVAMKDVQVVFHAAGNVRFGSKSLYRVNVQGTAAVVNAALKSGVERLVHTSSVSAIGKSEHTIADESSEWQNGSQMVPYARSKYLAEIEVQRGIAEGLDAVMVNPSLIFGPDHSKGKAPNIIHDYARIIGSGKLWFYPGGGTNVVDIDDVVTGHLLALERGHTGARYILGSENLSWNSLFSILSEAQGAKPPRIQLSYQLAVAGGILADIWSHTTGHKLPLGRSVVKYIYKNHRYSNKRATDELGCSFRPFQETAQRVADSLVADR
ncbi:MAG: NAD-dependent epimerase/dehydratase family protein [Bacteroidota bacterium]|nr:NAD-dependent epimerase/dehydratase family protein [Bacteroidota bacterium]